MAGTGVTVNSVLHGPTLSEGVAMMLEKERARSGRSIDQIKADFVITHRSSSIVRRAATVEEDQIGAGDCRHAIICLYCRAARP